MDEGFAGINPGRLQMIQDMDNAPPPRTLGAGSRGGRGGRGNGRGGRGRGRGGNRFQGGGQGGHGGRVGRRMVFGDGAPNMEEGNTATPEESESGLEIRNKAKRKRDAAEEGAINAGPEADNGEKKRRKEAVTEAAVRQKEPNGTKEKKDRKDRKDRKDKKEKKDKKDKKEKEKNEAKQEPIVNQTASDSSTTTGEDKRTEEKATKKEAKRLEKEARRLAKKAAKKDSESNGPIDAATDEHDGSVKKAKKHNKKDKKEGDSEDQEEEESRSVQSKSKKRKSENTEESTDASGTKSKKDKKEKKEKKDKKSKDGKKESKQKSKSREIASEPAKDTISSEVMAAKWNVSELSGGDARQSKFLRMLGGAKPGVTPATTTVRVPNSTSSQQREAELEKQFNAGLKMKHEAGGKRRGLGA